MATTTFSTLKTRALRLADQEDDSDAGNIAEYALEASLRYVASQVLLEDLISSATYTWQSGDTSASLSTDFAVSDMSTPVEAWVHDSGEDGVRYVYRPYLEWRRLKNQRNGSRHYLWSATADSNLPDRAFTIKDGDTFYFDTLPNTNQVVTFYYKVAPSNYTDAGTPEIHEEWVDILVFGAAAIIRDWVTSNMANELYNPNPYLVLKTLDPQIEEYKNWIRSNRASPQMRISRRYT